MITIDSSIGPLHLDVDRLAPKLWIGGAPYESGLFLKALGFDTIVLCALEYQPPDSAFPGLRVIRAPYDDAAVLPLASQKLVQRAARQVAGEVQRGRRTLVTCLAGRNRSGLVCARAMMKMSGAPAHLVVDHVQRLRKNALTNDTFVRELHAYQNVSSAVL